MRPDSLPCAPSIALALLLALAAGAEAGAAQTPSAAPVPVSPAGRVELACPTFSWSAAAGAPGYELVVYAVDADGEVGEAPLVSAHLPAGASSWTPSGADCFAARGRLAWSLRLLGQRGEAAWSAPMLFEVAAEPSAAEVKAAIETLRRYLARAQEGVLGDVLAEETPGALGPAAAPSGSATAPAPPSARRPPARSARAAGATLTARSAPSLGPPSLTLDGTVSLGAASHLFKDGDVFLWDSTTGNTALGRQALSSAYDSATQNTAVGTGALAAASPTAIDFHASRNTAVGYEAMTSTTTGYQNVAVGDEALAGNFGGSLNTAIGTRALVSNTAGNRNTASGASALQYNTGGDWNTALGVFALRNNTSGDSNTAIGYKALHQTTGTGNVALGAHAGIHATDGSDNVFIANGGGSEDSETIRIGSVQDRTFVAGIHGKSVASSLNEMTVLVDSSGKLGTLTSSRRFKEGIAGVGDASRRLLELRPVRFRYKEQEGQGPERFGLVAEEVAEVFPELVVRDAEGRPLSVRYHLLAPLLLSELQRAYREMEGVRTELAGQREELEALRQQVTANEK